jgi:hypothetical protein
MVHAARPPRAPGRASALSAQDVNSQFCHIADGGARLDGSQPILLINGLCYTGRSPKVLVQVFQEDPVVFFSCLEPVD